MNQEIFKCIVQTLHATFVKCLGPPKMISWPRFHPKYPHFALNINYTTEYSWKE